jgi:hypothetical protein
VPNLVRGFFRADTRSAGSLVAAVVVFVLAAATVGIASALIFLGTALLAWAIRLLFPEVSGPSSWAVGLLLELSFLVVVNMVLAFVLHGPLARWECILQLVLPVLVALACGAWRAATRHGTSLQEPNSRSLLALVVAAVVLVAYLILQHHGKNYGIAWAMSGDARDHVQIMRSIISSGGLTVHELKSYPAIVNTVSAIISVADGRSGLLPGDLMVHDVQAVASTYVLSIIGIATLFMASLYQFVPKVVRELRRIPVALTTTMLACAGIAVTPLVLGTALNEGYLSAYGALPIALAVVVLALDLCERPSFPMLVLLGVGTVITMFSWTMLVIVPGSAALIVALVYIRRVVVRRDHLVAYLRERWVWLLAAAFSYGLIMVLAIATVVQRRVLETQLSLPGAIIAPSEKLLFLVGLVSLGFLCVSPTSLRKLRLAIPIACAVLGMIAVHWINTLAHTQGPAWTYYAAKTEWLIASSIVWVAFVPIAISASKTRVPTRAGSWLPVFATVQALAFSTVIYLLLTITTTLTSPIPIAFRGWTQPAAKEVSIVQQIGNKKAHFAVWNYLNAVDDRLGNFWAGLIWDTTGTGLRKRDQVGQYSSFIEWAYFEQDTAPSICDVAKSSPGVIIVTRDASLRKEMDESCPSNGARIIVHKGAP